MKNIILYFGFFFMSVAAIYAQPVNKFTGEMEVPTPEAAALGKYTDIPVNLSTGTVSVSVPITTLSNGPLNLGVSVDYHTGGIRLSEMASWVGLGWSLNAGGMISRSVNGIPDDYDLYGKGYFHNGGNLNHPLDEYNDETQEQVKFVHRGSRDAEPDIFSFNFNGYTGKFFFNANQEIVQLTASDLSIDYSLTSANEFGQFTITTPDGTKYIFGSLTSNGNTLNNVERIVSPSLENDQHYNSTFYLSRIESFDGIYAIDLNYEYEGVVTYFTLPTNYMTINRPSYTCTCAGFIEGNACQGEGNILQDPPYNNSPVENKYHKWRLSNISSTLETINFIGSPRGDLPGTEKLQSIHIRNQGSLTSLYKKFKFSYTHMVSNTDGISPMTHDRKLRLILNSIQETSWDEAESKPPFIFTYHEGTLPERLDLGRDHWGFYNGALGNGSLNLGGIPPNPLQNPNITFPAFTGNREVNLSKMKYGVLKSVQYPTGGRRELDLKNNIATKYLCEDIEGWSYIFSMNSCSHPYSENCCGNTLLTEAYTHDGSQPLEDYRYVISGKKVYTPSCTTGETVTSAVLITVFDSNGTEVGADIITWTGAPGSEEIKERFLQDLFTPVQGETYTIELETIESALGGFYIKEHYENTICDYVTFDAGGLRIEKIKTYRNETDNSPKVTTYTYEHEGHGTGYFRNKPIYGGEMYRWEQGLTDFSLGYKVYSEAYFPLTSFNGNIVTYEHIYEHTIGDNSRTRYTFDIEAPGSTDDAPNHPYYQIPLAPVPLMIMESTLKKKEIMDLSNNVKYRETYNYYSPEYSNNNDVIYKTDGYLTPQVLIDNGLVIPPCNFTSVKLYYLRVGQKRLQQKITWTDGVETIESYEYDALNRHQMPTATEVTNSDGKVHRTESIYIHDYPYGAGIKDYCIDNNLIAPPYKAVKKVNGQMVEGSETQFGLFGASIPRIQKYFSFERDLNGGAGNWILKATVDSYQYGNPHEVTLAGWDTETYNWDYDLLTSRSFESFNWNYNYYPGTKYLNSTTDIDGQVISYSYDKLQRLHVLNQRDGAITTTYGYSYGSVNEVGQTTEFGDAPTQSTSQQFDGLGRPIASIVNGAIKEEQIYDDQGHVIEKSYLPGLFKEIAYDPLDRPISELYPDGSITTLDYGANGQFYKQTYTDENGNATISLTDIIGRQVKTIDALNGNTSNLYDDKGNLVKVSAPDGSIYTYIYDARNRLKQKTIPAGGTQKFIYDERDLLIASQDENLSGNGKWLVTNYDNYGRPTLSGFYNSATIPQGVPNLSIDDVLTETYYDSYVNLPPSEFAEVADGYSGCSSGQILNGKIVGARVNILENNLAGTEWQASVNCYDQYGRVEKTKSTNHLGGTDEMVFDLNMADLMDVSTRHHIVNNETTTIEEEFSYDNFLRIEENWHTLNGGPKVKIAHNHYNDQDQLHAKAIGGYWGLTPGVPDYLQHIDYTYNIRGWLTHINEVPTGGDDTPIPDCDTTIPPECGPACDYTINFQGSYEGLAYPIIGIYVKGDQLMDLNYPIHQPFSNLENEIEQWLWDNGYTFESVHLTSHGNDYTLRIIQSAVVFNKMRQVNPFGFGFESYFEKSNCDGPIEVPKTICDLCRQDGYSCDRCPYWELEEPCTTCQNLSIADCVNCAYAEDICTRCTNLGYPDCTSCPLTVAKVQALKVQVEYDHSLLSGGLNDGALLVRVSDRSIAYQHDGTAQLRESKNMAMVGQGPFMGLSTNVYPNVMEITLGNQWVNQGTIDSVIIAAENQIVSELINAGIDDPATQTAFVEAVMQQVAAAWGGTTDTEIPSEGYSQNPDVFSMELYYGNSHEMISSPAQLNGNIAGVVWKTGFGAVQSYSFEYDAINRLTSGLYRDDTGGGNYATDNKYGVSMTYDAVGNIQTLSRRGVDDICINAPADPLYEFTQIDNLSYSYANSRLESIVESSNPERGYKGTGGTYSYDANGNMTRDNNKQMSIAYNHQNLPYRIAFDNGNLINFTYDATGVKLRKHSVGQENGESVDDTKDYVGGIEYKNGMIEAIYHAEGRVIFNEASEPVYEYNLKDHLGNVRAVISDRNNNGYLEPFSFDPTLPLPNEDEYSELLQENHYYPFGMEMEGAWELATSTPENQYNYNGKEIQGDFGLDWLDYGARMYDASIGRWNAVDLLAEIYYPYSSYSYVINNPISFIDPNGMEVVNYGGGNLHITGEDAVNYFKGLQNAEKKKENTEISETNEDCCPGLAVAAETVLSGIALDVSIPDPSDAVGVKWLGYIAVGVVATLVYEMTSEGADTKETPIDFTVKIDGVEVPKRVALGTNKDLFDFAGRVGALPYPNWGTFIPSETTAAAYITSIVAMAETNPNLTFHFNLTDGLTGNRIDQTYQRKPGAITTAEYILLSTVYRDRTTFYVKSGSIYKEIPK